MVGQQRLVAPLHRPERLAEGGVLGLAAQRAQEKGDAEGAFKYLEAGVKQNGLLTQGEDTADNGGIYLALIGLENTLKQQGKTLETKGDDGLTEIQRFFLSFANNWCSQLRPEIMRTVVLTNPHSMPKYRVNNTVANMPEFAKAFGCAKGKPLVHENACRVW